MKLFPCISYYIIIRYGVSKINVKNMYLRNRCGRDFISCILVYIKSMDVSKKCTLLLKNSFLGNGLHLSSPLLFLAPFVCAVLCVRSGEAAVPTVLSISDFVTPCEFGIRNSACRHFVFITP